jgi:hypothetical protein
MFSGCLKYNPFSRALQLPFRKMSHPVTSTASPLKAPETEDDRFTTDIRRPLDSHPGDVDQPELMSFEIDEEYTGPSGSRISSITQHDDLRLQFA